MKYERGRMRQIYTCLSKISMYPLPFPCKSKVRQTPGMEAKTHTGQVLIVDYQTKAVSHFRTVFTRQPVTKHSKWRVIDKAFQKPSDSTDFPHCWDAVPWV